MLHRLPMAVLCAGIVAAATFSGANPLAARPSRAEASTWQSWQGAKRGPLTVEMATVLPADAGPGRLPELPAVAAVDAGPRRPGTASRTVRAGGNPFAGVEGLQLRLPHGVHTVGFHESGSGGALHMHPVGVPRVNDNAGRLASAPVDEARGPEYLVLGSRGRRMGPTSAVDLAMPFNHPVTSPVTGTVVDVGTYALYGRVPDNRIVLRPDARPDLHLIVLHVNGVRVATGDRVVAGESVLALTARVLPFSSQIEHYSGQLPHVHLELRGA